MEHGFPENGECPHQICVVMKVCYANIEHVYCLSDYICPVIILAVAFHLKIAPNVPIAA